jgi:6,7-dimethyl-8-ribityllumazine synthase
MFGADKGHVDAGDARMNGKKLKIGIVQARFNASVTDALAQACKAELLALGVAEKDIDHVTVPGALEVPVALQAWPRKPITTHWLPWAASSAAKPTTLNWWPTNPVPPLHALALDYQLPIANAILTTEDMGQAIARQEEKGRDAARVAVEMANLLESM